MDKFFRGTKISVAYHDGSHDFERNLFYSRKQELANRFVRFDHIEFPNRSGDDVEAEKVRIGVELASAFHRGPQAAVTFHQIDEGFSRNDIEETWELEGNVHDFFEEFGPSSGCDAHGFGRPESRMDVQAVVERFEEWKNFSDANDFGGDGGSDVFVRTCPIEVVDKIPGANRVSGLPPVRIGWKIDESENEFSFRKAFSDIVFPEKPVGDIHSHDFSTVGADGDSEYGAGNSGIDDSDSAYSIFEGFVEFVHADRIRNYLLKTDSIEEQTRSKVRMSRTMLFSSATASNVRDSVAQIPALSGESGRLSFIVSACSFLHLAFSTSATADCPAIHWRISATVRNCGGMRISSSEYPRPSYPTFFTSVRRWRRFSMRVRPRKSRFFGSLRPLRLWKLPETALWSLLPISRPSPYPSMSRKGPEWLICNDAIAVEYKSLSPSGVEPHSRTSWALREFGSEEAGMNSKGSGSTGTIAISASTGARRAFTRVRISRSSATALLPSSAYASVLNSNMTETCSGERRSSNCGQEERTRSSTHS